ncbi:MAG: hypothetical protein ACSW8A_00570 [Lachnospiraceae bacterium]
MVADIILVLTVLISALLGMRKGALYMLWGLACIVFPIVFALWLAPHTTNFLVNTIHVNKYIQRSAEKTIEGVVGIDKKSVSEKKKEESLTALRIPESWRGDLKKHDTDKGYETYNAETFAEYAAASVGKKGAHALGFLLSFLLAFVVMMFITIAGKMTDRIVGVRTVNHLGGFLLGTVRGFLIVGLIMMMVSFLSQFALGKFLLEKGDGYVMSFLYKYNVLSYLPKRLF